MQRTPWEPFGARCAIFQDNARIGQQSCQLPTRGLTSLIVVLSFLCRLSRDERETFGMLPVLHGKLPSTQAINYLIGNTRCARDPASLRTHPRGSISIASTAFYTESEATSKLRILKITTQEIKRESTCPINGPSRGPLFSFRTHPS